MSSKKQNRNIPDDSSYGCDSLERMSFSLPLTTKNLENRLALPAIAAPMFLISNPEMVIQCCKNAVIGSFPALNQRTNEGLEEWLKQINDALDPETDAPYAVNLIVNPQNVRLKDDLMLCIKYKVPIIITSLGLNPDLIKAVHDYGGLIFHDVTKLRHAQKAVDAGVDGLIAVCAGAGGHAGTLNPFAFVAEIRKIFDGYLVLAGAISKGSDVRAAEIMGADFAYMGTRFINTEEAGADQGYKEMIKGAQASDIIYTDAVSGVSANFMAESLKNAGFDPKQPQADRAALKSIESEFKAWKTIWSAGHGVGAIDNVLSVKELITSLKSEYDGA